MHSSPELVFPCIRSLLLFVTPLKPYHKKAITEETHLNSLALCETIGSESKSWIPMNNRPHGGFTSIKAQTYRRPWGLAWVVVLSKPGLCHVSVIVSSRAVDRSSKPADTNYFCSLLRTPKSPKGFKVGKVHWNHYRLDRYKTEWSWKCSFMSKTKLDHILP